MDNIRWWIKSWFFETESQCEYLFSRHLFFNWLQSLSSILGELFVSLVKHWVKTKLDPYDTMWLNHRRLFICGINARTTSNAESMHSSMKSGCDKVYASDSISKSATKMMDKSIRRGKDISRFNAHEISRNRTNNHSKRGTYLTDYAYKMTEEQMELSKSCRVIQLSETKFHVYTPDISDKLSPKSPIPKFYRLRTVEIFNGTQLFCSCGHPSRLKMPCRHIISIFGEYNIEMFGLRWLILYQYAFDRPGYDNLSGLFRKMEAEEFSQTYNSMQTIKLSRDLKDRIKCINDMTFPVPIGMSTTSDLQNIIIMQKCMNEQKVLVRGYSLEEQMTVSQNQEENHDGSINISLSQDTEVTFSRDGDFLQRLQNDQIKTTNLKPVVLKATNENCIVTVRECLKAIEDNTELLDEYISQLNCLCDKYYQIASEKKRKHSELNIDGSTIEFPYTGKTNKRIDRRKGF